MLLVVTPASLHFLAGQALIFGFIHDTKLGVVCCTRPLPLDRGPAAAMAATTAPGLPPLGVPAWRFGRAPCVARWQTSCPLPHLQVCILTVIACVLPFFSQARSGCKACCCCPFRSERVCLIMPVACVLPVFGRARRPGGASCALMQ